MAAAGPLANPLTKNAYICKKSKWKGRSTKGKKTRLGKMLRRVLAYFLRSFCAEAMTPLYLAWM